jgi:hypothetical protein
MVLPTDTEVAGELRVMPVRVGGVTTVTVITFDVMLPEEAVTLVVPSAAAVKIPLEPGLKPTVVLLEVKVTFVTCPVELSEKVPVAVNVTVVPLETAVVTFGTEVRVILVNVTGAAAVTVTASTFEVTPPLEAEMLVLPAASVVKAPVALGAAPVAGVLEAQVTAEVRFWVLPSEYLPVAVKATAVPTVRFVRVVGFDVIAIEVKVGTTPELTVTVMAFEVTPLLLAVTLVVPAARPVKAPVELGAAPTLVLLEAQVTVEVSNWVVPSEKLPVAVKVTAPPTDTVAGLGLDAIVIEVSDAEFCGIPAWLLVQPVSPAFTMANKMAI